MTTTDSSDGAGSTETGTPQAPRRRSLPAGLKLLVVLAIGWAAYDFLSGMARGVSESRQNRQVAAEMQRSMENERARLRDKLTAEGALEVTAADVDRVQQKLADHAAQMTGKARQFTEAAVAAQEPFMAATKAYQQAYGAFVDAGGCDPEQLRTPTDVRTRRELSEAAHTASMATVTTLERVPRDLEARLRDLGASQHEVTEALDSYKCSGRYDTVLILRRADAACIGAGVALLRFLEESWGQWRYDTDTARLVFDADAQATEYTALLTRLQDQANETVRLQHEVLGVQMPPTSEPAGASD